MQWFALWSSTYSHLKHDDHYYRCPIDARAGGEKNKQWKQIPHLSKEKPGVTIGKQVRDFDVSRSTQMLQTLTPVSAVV